MKRSKIATLLLTGALSVSMLAAGAMTAFANTTADAPDDNDFVGGTDKVAKIQKNVTKASGVTNPANDFKFTFTPGTNNPDRTTIDPKVVSVSAGAESGSLDLNLASIFAGSKTGTYTYTISETTQAPVNGYGWTSDTKTYTLTVFRQANGTVNYTIADSTGEKIDSDSDGKGTFEFTNVFTKRAGSDPENPNDEDNDKKTDSLVVSKTVSGEGGSNDQEFTFTITFNPDAINSENGANIDLTSVNKVNSEGVVTSATVTNGGTFTLKSGEKMVFNNIPAGTTATVTEDTDTVDGYTPSYSVTSNGNGNGTDATNVLLGEKANVIAVTNTADTVTITGLALQAAPYVALIGLALAMMAAYVVLRRRAENN